MYQGNSNVRVKFVNSQLPLIEKINKQLVDKFNFNPDNFHFTGTFTLYNNLLQSLFNSQIKTIASVFVIIFIVFVFKKINH